MFRIPSAWAPRRSPWMPMRFRSRHGEVHADVEARRLAHEERGGQDRHPDSPERAVVDVDDLHAPLGEELRALDELLDVVAPRRDRAPPSPGTPPRGAARGAARAPRSPRGPAPPPAPARRSGRDARPLGAARAPGMAVHRLAHRADVGRRRPAAAADDPRPGLEHAGGVVGHVRGRREVDQPLAVPAREPGVRPDRHPGPGRRLVEDQPHVVERRSTPRRSSPR